MGVADEYSLADSTTLTAQGGRTTLGHSNHAEDCRGPTPLNLYQGQVASMFEHVFESYQGKDQERKDHPSGKVKTCSGITLALW